LIEDKGIGIESLADNDDGCVEFEVSYLIPLADHNAEVTAHDQEQRRPKANGIACPIATQLQASLIPLVITQQYTALHVNGEVIDLNE